MVMVRPPPGVASGFSVPRIASVSPRATVSPSPTPRVVPADGSEQCRPRPVGVRDRPGRLGLRDRRSRLPGTACGVAG